MLNNLMNPTTLFVIGLAAVSVLIIILALSIWYYCKAKDIAPHLSKLESLLDAISDAQKTLEINRQAIQGTLDEQAKAQRLISDGHAAKTWLDENKPKVEALKNEVEVEKGKLKTAEDAFSVRQDELNGLIQQIADKSLEIKNATQKKDALDVVFAKLEEEIKVRTKTVEGLKASEENLKSEIDVLEKKKNELDSIVQGLERKREECNKLDERSMKLRSEIGNLEGSASAAQKILATLDAVRNDSKEKWKDLDRPIIAAISNRQSTVIDESQWLEQFASMLEDNHITFSPRAIKAFHTGLKSADISPLVVLAGISGTGKSLLPELYAASLGMNFLPVAVQPRWDSPQDMFGFYNYMEGRYKATELSRLMWQFDVYNNHKVDSPPLQHLPMNLVLLDEMNLARVEYYFSDLLSKLEMRRGLNFDDPKSRCKAEIEIECNASTSNEHTRRLFVAPNTLFIGTMNEDESTQTLSDKVIDRSNVLRFGRPKELGVEPNKEGFMRECENLPRIDSGNWKAWQNENVPRKEEMKRILGPINPVLERVGRPFAYRVWQAMEKYVCVYPGNAPDDFSAAVADQIEMKILPKLNGLELDANGFDEVKRVIEGAIHATEDPELEKAFKDSCDVAYGSFFKWRGVMR